MHLSILAMGHQRLSGVNSKRNPSEPLYPQKELVLKDLDYRARPQQSCYHKCSEGVLWSTSMGPTMAQAGRKCVWGLQTFVVPALELLTISRLYLPASEEVAAFRMICLLRCLLFGPQRHENPPKRPSVSCCCSTFCLQNTQLLSRSPYS